jgi:dipeptidyl aminopeptidase/acylaminoacyl peptidase
LVLSVDGEQFAITSTVRFGEVPVPTTFVTPRRLEARIPTSLLASPGVVAVLVSDTAVGGGRSNAVSFTVVNPPPQIALLDAPPLKTGGPATTFTVRGRDFRPNSHIQIAGTSVATQYRTDQELSAVVPAEVLAKPGSLPVAVIAPGPGGGTSNSMALTVLAPFPGRFLAFTSTRRGGRNHLYLLDREAGRLDPLEEANSPNGSDGYPSISADGRFIVFQSDRHGEQTDVLLFDRETRTLDPLPELNHPTAFDGFPHISADGRFIVFESDRLNKRPKIFLFDRQTRTLSEVSQANEATAEDGLAAISN